MGVGIPVDAAVKLLIQLLDSDGAPVESQAYNSDSPSFAILHVPADGTDPTEVAITLASSSNYEWAELSRGWYSVTVPATGGTSGAMNDVKGGIMVTGKFDTTVEGIGLMYEAVDADAADALAAIAALSDETKGLKVDMDYVRGDQVSELVATRLDVSIGAVQDDAIDEDGISAAAATKIGTATLAVTGLDSGTAQAGSATTLTLRSGAPAVDLSGNVLLLLDGPGAGQFGVISSYDTGSKVATMVSSWPGTAPTSATRYAVLRMA